jgi:hypothetical protein
VTQIWIICALYNEETINYVLLLMFNHIALCIDCHWILLTANWSSFIDLAISIDIAVFLTEFTFEPKYLVLKALV